MKEPKNPISSPTTANIKSFCQREQLFYKKHYISG